jgi:hypothetical protein
VRDPTRVSTVWCPTSMLVTLVCLGGWGGGAFFFTVLDNSITSREFWGILGATDNMSWGLSFYSRATSAHS